MSPSNILAAIFDWFYVLFQRFIILVFKPAPPSQSGPLQKPYGRIAVVGAGLTGISSAAHAIASNFEVVIFESGDSVGGIWANVNSTSGLQLNSLLYRFHPAVLWSHAFPHRDEILHEIRRIWTEYKLESRTRFNTKVTQISRAAGSTDPSELGHGLWVVNDGSDGVFDAVIVTIGTCGEPKKIHFPGMEEFRGKLMHSSELDDADLEGKDVVVVGGGASGVEAIELAIKKKAKSTVIVAREDKWIIPRNIVFDTLISMQPFGREMPLSFVYERLIKRFHYGDQADLAPKDKGIFEGTPIVNDDFLGHVRTGKCKYLRGDGKTLTTDGVKITMKSPPDGKSGDDGKEGHEGEERDLNADIIVLATGFERPSIDFLPKDLFPEDYSRPNLYLQNFSTEDWSILMTNSSYVNGIGTVGHFHIGIYTRILITLLLDRQARPLPKDMKLWVDNLAFLKRGAAGGALGFFTYAELTVWLVAFHIFRPDRLRWMFFILNGWKFGSSLRA